MTGAGAAALAIGLIAWLAAESWAISACQDLLHTSAFDADGRLLPDAPPQAVAFAGRAAAQDLTAEETACKLRLGKPR